MSTLDRYFGIFVEGADDAKHRARAREVEQKLLKALEHINRQSLVFPKAGHPTVAVDIGVAVDDPTLKGVNLYFVPRDEAKKETRRGAFIRNMRTNERRIELYVDVPTDVFSTLKPEGWRNVIAKKGSMIFDRMQEIFWHEFIHFLDHERIHPDSRKKAFGSASSLTGPRDPKKYFNDPLEYNAFVQQGLTRVENHLSKLDSWEGVQKLIGNSPSEFYRLVLKVLSPGMRQHMSDKYKSKLKKRVAQMWNDTKSRFGGGSKND